MHLIRRDKPYVMTGRHVLFWLLAFFAVVFTVNALMMRVAISTFGGVTAASSYQAGLQFKNEAAVAERQDALHWQVNGRLGRDNKGRTTLDIVARDAGGTPLAGLTARARLAHPADERLDQIIDVQSTATGAFHGRATIQPGQRDLIVDLYRGDQRLFRSRNRITLR